MSDREMCRRCNWTHPWDALCSPQEKKTYPPTDGLYTGFHSVLDVEAALKRT